MKNLFTKYLQFEAEHRDEDVYFVFIIFLQPSRYDNVEELVRQYTSKMNKDNSDSD